MHCIVWINPSDTRILRQSVNFLHPVATDRQDCCAGGIFYYPWYRDCRFDLDILLIIEEHCLVKQIV
jgi:hypothetical protein